MEERCPQDTDVATVECEYIAEIGEGREGVAGTWVGEGLGTLTEAIGYICCSFVALFLYLDIYNTLAGFVDELKVVFVSLLLFVVSCLV